MGMPIHLAWNLTHHELLSASGERWAEIIVPENSLQLEMTITTGEMLRGAPDDVYLTVHRHIGRYKGRQQVDVGVGLAGGDWKTWIMPATAAEGRFAIRTRAGATSGHVRWSTDRMRVEVLDPDGRLRVILSPDEPPAAAGERLRGMLNAGDRSAPMLHFALVDGDRPRGRTWVTSPPKNPPPVSFPRFTRHELLTATRRSWAHVTVPELGNGCSLAVFAPAGESAVDVPVIQLGVGFPLEPPGPAGGGERHRQALLWIDRGTGGRPEAWSFPAPGPAGRSPLDSRTGATCATLEWTADRSRVALLDGDGNPRVVFAFDEPPAAAGERCRLLLRPHASGAPPLHLQLIDGALPPGPTHEYMTP